MSRPTVKVTKPYTLEQLDRELGSHGLCADAEVICVADGSPITQKQLETAYDAHVAGPTDQEIRAAKREAVLAALAAAAGLEIDEVKEVLG